MKAPQRPRLAPRFCFSLGRNRITRMSCPGAEGSRTDGPYARAGYARRTETSPGSSILKILAETLALCCGPRSFCEAQVIPTGEAAKKLGPAPKKNHVKARHVWQHRCHSTPPSGLGPPPPPHEDGMFRHHRPATKALQLLLIICLSSGAQEIACPVFYFPLNRRAATYSSTRNSIGRPFRLPLQRHASRCFPGSSASRQNKKTDTPTAVPCGNRPAFKSSGTNSRPCYRQKRFQAKPQAPACVAPAASPAKSFRIGPR